MDAPLPPSATAPVWVRFVATVDPTPTDRMRYDAGSVWQVRSDVAEQLVQAGAAEYSDAPTAATRPIAEPLEPPQVTICFASDIPAHSGQSAIPAGSVRTLPHYQAQAYLDARVATLVSPASTPAAPAPGAEEE